MSFSSFELECPLFGTCESAGSVEGTVGKSGRSGKSKLSWFAGGILPRGAGLGFGSF